MVILGVGERIVHAIRIDALRDELETTPCSAVIGLRDGPASKVPIPARDNAVFGPALTASPGPGTL
jgi:hypothetical protein